MKIDTSHIRLSSTRAFSKKNQITIEKEITFPDLFDQGVTRFNTTALSRQVDADAASQWYRVTSFNEKAAVEVSRQFLNELEKMRQIFDAILERFCLAGFKGSSLQLASLDRVNINPYPRRSVEVLEYDYLEKRTHTHHEKEATSFFAEGIVNTLDGKSMDFSFQMDLEREFFREDQFIHHEKGSVLIDPLVINLDSTIPRLSEATISFDINMDGKKEDIPLLMPGSGFLSLDKDKNGIITDGSELFGPSTGNGFGELSEYDLDNNFWIDENDQIFDQLTLWENNEAGEMQLTRIKDAGIGAIYLVAEQTAFDLRNQDNQLQTRIKKTGIALNEDLSVSSIQEMDWTS